MSDISSKASYTVCFLLQGLPRYPQATMAARRPRTDGIGECVGEGNFELDQLCSNVLNILPLPMQAFLLIHSLSRLVTMHTNLHHCYAKGAVCGSWKFYSNQNLTTNRLDVEQSEPSTSRCLRFLASLLDQVLSEEEGIFLLRTRRFETVARPTGVTQHIGNQLR